MSLSKKVLEENEKLVPKVKNCLEMVKMGYFGRYQMYSAGKSYCGCLSYCTLQKGEPKACRGRELYDELIANR